MAAVEPAWPTLPKLSLDVLPGGRFEFAYQYFRGVGNVECIIDPMTVADVDTLYTYFAADSFAAPDLHGKPCAIRWQDPNLESEVIWFAFPLYWFEQDQAEEAVKVVLTELLRP